MRRIYEDRKDVLMKAIDIATTRTIQISQAVTGDWQIGWASVGTVDPRDAEYFAGMINRAVNVANMLTRQQIHFVETEECDPEIDSDERFDECVKYVTEWFESGEYRKIEAWIIAGGIDEYEKLDALLTPGAEAAKNDELTQEILSGEFDPSNNFMADIMERKMAGSITEDEILEIARREFDRGNVYKDKTKGVYREVGSDMYICPIESEPENVDEVVQKAIEVAEGTKDVPSKFLKLYDEDGEVRGYKLGDHYLMKVYGWSGYSWVINKDGRRHYSSVDYSNALANHEVESVSSCKAGKARLKELAGVKEPATKTARMNNPRYCGGKEQEKMMARGWKLKIAEGPRETPQEIFDRLIQSYDRVKIYWDTTRVKGLHSYFAMVK